MVCAECSSDFQPDAYEEVCNACGWLAERRQEAQDFDDGQLTLAELACRAAGVETRVIRRRWRVG